MSVSSRASGGGPPAKRTKTDGHEEDGNERGSSPSGKFRGRKESDNTCPICQEAVSETDKAVLVPCCHDFHKACIDTWTERKNTCPECRQTVTQVKWNIKSDSEFESRDIAVPAEEGFHLRIAMAPISPTTFAVYIFPIPAIEMMSTQRTVTLIHRREGQPDDTVATIGPQQRHVFSVAQLMGSEDYVVRDNGIDYPVEHTFALLILEQVIANAEDMGITLDPDEAPAAGPGAGRGRGSIPRSGRGFAFSGQITSGSSSPAEGPARGRGMPFPLPVMRNHPVQPPTVSRSPASPPPSPPPSSPSSCSTTASSSPSSSPRASDKSDKSPAGNKTGRRSDDKK